MISENLWYGFPKILTFESANMHFGIGSESKIIDIYLLKEADIKSFWS